MSISSTTWFTFAVWVIVLAISLTNAKRVRSTGPLLGGVASILGIYLGLSVFNESVPLAAILIVMNLAYLFVVIAEEGK